MSRCVIFCAAGFEGLLSPLKQDDFVIAADGGLAHAQALGITPDLTLGDFDSLGYTPQGAAVYPVEKDDTDSMLAVREGLARGFREFVLYGALDGARLDHTVANYQTLQFLADRGARGTLVGEHFLATVIKNGQITFPPRFSGTVSVFCMGPDARGVTETGLYYGLDNATLTAGFPLGVSNRFTGEPACIRVEAGSLLVLWQRQRS